MFKALFRKLFNAGSTPAQQAYDLWATAYDNQPDNLMLALDDQLFSAFLQTVDIKNKELVDIGCGTGRYWQKILDRGPRQLVGYDVSAGMLQILRKKFPMAVSFQLSGNHLAQTPDKSVELLISTLTMAHIKDAAAALQEWNRVALPAADIFITDYHPDILQKGGKRTFSYDDKTVSVKNYTHSIEKLKMMAKKLNWQVVLVTELRIGEELKHFYEKQGALKVYELYKGMPVIYSIHFKKEK